MSGPHDLDALAEARLDGDLDDARWRSLELEHGAPLVDALARARALRGAVASAPRPVMPADLRAAVLAAVPAVAPTAAPSAKPAAAPIRFRSRVVVPLALAAGLVLAFLVTRGWDRAEPPVATVASREPAVTIADPAAPRARLAFDDESPSAGDAAPGAFADEALEVAARDRGVPAGDARRRVAAPDEIEKSAKVAGAATSGGRGDAVDGFAAEPPADVGGGAGGGQLPRREAAPTVAPSAAIGAAAPRRTAPGAALPAPVTTAPAVEARALASEAGGEVADRAVSDQAATAGDEYQSLLEEAHRYRAQPPPAVAAVPPSPLGLALAWVPPARARQANDAKGAVDKAGASRAEQAAARKTAAPQEADAAKLDVATSPAGGAAPAAPPAAAPPATPALAAKPAASTPVRVGAALRVALRNATVGELVVPAGALALVATDLAGNEIWRAPLRADEELRIAGGGELTWDQPLVGALAPPAGAVALRLAWGQQRSPPLAAP